MRLMECFSSPVVSLLVFLKESVVFIFIHCFCVVFLKYNDVESSLLFCSNISQLPFSAYESK